MAPKSHGRKKPRKPRAAKNPQIVKPDVNDIDVSGKIVSHQNYQLRSAPLPLPSELADYGKVDPSFPNRIFVMAEKQQRASNRSKFFENITSAMLVFSGQLFAFVALLGILYLIYYAITEENVTASIYLPVSAAAIISAFIIRRTRKK